MDTEEGPSRSPNRARGGLRLYDLGHSEKRLSSSATEKSAKQVTSKAGSSLLRDFHRRRPCQRLYAARRNIITPKTMLIVASGDSPWTGIWPGNWVPIAIALEDVQLAGCWQRDMWSDSAPPKRAVRLVIIQTKGLRRDKCRCITRNMGLYGNHGTI